MFSDDKKKKKLAEIPFIFFLQVIYVNKSKNWPQLVGPLRHNPATAKARTTFGPVYRNSSTAYLLVFPADIEHDFIPARAASFFL